jgi:hypothetical protein
MENPSNKRGDTTMSEPFAVGGGVGPYTPSLIGGTGTTAKIFPNLLANATGLPAGFGVGSPAASAPYAPAVVTIPGTGQFEQQKISLVAGGYLYVHGTTPTVNFVVQNGTSLTATSNTTVATLTSVQTLTTANFYPWSVTLSLQGDANSGVLQVFSATIACNGVSGTATLTDLTGVNLTTTALNFVVGITFGVSDALNVGALSQFSLTAA